MASNPFDPNYNNLLAALTEKPRNLLTDFIAPYPKPKLSPPVRDIVNALMSSPANEPGLAGNGVFGSGLGDAFGSLAPSPFAPPTPPAPSRPTFQPFLDLIEPPRPYAPPPPIKPLPITPETKRKAFFSFHFDDIMRVNNVRNAWKIDHRDSPLNRSFYDSSLWESRKLLGIEGIKNLIRVGVTRTSAVCVLAGSQTWSRRWVRYEIARAILDQRGLLTVHLNSLPHHRTKFADAIGRNPLAHMGIAKIQRHPRVPPRYHLYEMNLVVDGFGRIAEEWQPYPDYTLAVKKPAWVDDPQVGWVVPLSVNAAEYDHVLDNGQRNIGHWIDLAAKQAGR
jgi:hypothetical protein